MASFEMLHERLAALQETTAQLRELIDRLANIKFQPGSVPLNTSDEDNVAAELGAEINQVLREEEEDLELLHEEITDLRSGRPGSDAEHRKARLKEGAHRLNAELHDCRTAFRRAQLSARRSLEAAQKLERDLLLASYAASATSSSTTTTTTTTPQNRSGATSPDPLRDPDPRAQLFTPRDRRRLRAKHHSGPPGQTGGSDDGNILAASTDVTLSLRRTHALVAGEVARSAFAAQTLAESSAALAELRASYDGLDGVLARSRDLVAALLTAQKSDTWYLRAALRVLLCTLAWLVFRRWLYGPLWWLVWLPVRTGWRVGWGVSSSVGARGGGRERGRMEVVGADGGVRVVGVGEDGAVPTVQVGRSEERGGPDSMVEKVGRMVEDTLNRRAEEEEEEEEAEAANRTAAEREADAQKNPMKRMWEEESQPAREPKRVRDEL
ncbi:hypothetical protein BT67DRAFT_460531 [Trichocladium antarcticum]|uniref:Sec20 C-terminal domain-containing protein n=1 Tax=Trichocladium antarcticum TaxID=1450529 RepID=A0AAN6UNN6_9PEZI|nr:hypothetical protein BT67DRAFT_460531 [Trichocladium antarcticum]